MDLIPLDKLAQMPWLNPLRALHAHHTAIIDWTACLACPAAHDQAGGASRRVLGLI